MAFIYVTYGGRGQVQRLLVGANDTFTIRRFYINQPIDDMVNALRDEADLLNSPPILFDISNQEVVLLMRKMIKAGYRRIVRWTPSETFGPTGGD